MRAREQRRLRQYPGDSRIGLPLARSSGRVLLHLLVLVAFMACGSTRSYKGQAHDPCALLDSDGDGLPDVWELLKYGTDPYSADSDGDGISDSDWRERREHTYTIRAIVKVAVPLPPIEELNTIFQDVRLLGRRGSVSELEVVLYPGARVGPGIEKYQSKNRCTLSNFDILEVDPDFVEEMRALASAAESTSTQMETLLGSVFGQTRRSVPFNAFYLSKKDGVVSVEPRARSVLSDPDADPQELWNRELDPSTMWNRRERGECTSSAVLGHAALSAIEVPARLALFIPLLAPQEMLREVWDPRALRGVGTWRRSSAGCSSHTVVEILSGDRWIFSDEGRIRDTPFELGLGPLIQLRTASSIGELIEPELWGAACAGNGPLEGTRNVYRIVHLSDAWGTHTGDLEIEGIGRAPPRTLTISDIFPFDSPKRPDFIPADAVQDPSRFFLAKAEIDEETAPGVPYFYRCADKSLPPFKFVRGHWGAYFLLEKVGDAPTLEALPERSPGACRWVLEDSDFTR